MSYFPPKKDQKRFQVAYLKINLGLTLKEISYRLGMNPHTVEYFWGSAKKTICGR
jgi:DNA-binding CsgD family transcriptional regulator